MAFSLIEVDGEGDGSGSGTVPPEYAIRRVHGVTLGSTHPQTSAAFLANVVEIESPTVNISTEELGRGSMGPGAVHHVAFRVDDDVVQEIWLDKLTSLGLHVSPVMDRQYFHSIYFKEPGGVLFEIATDPPGFTADEPVETLGTRLCLPEWLEEQRVQIESVLPKLVAYHPPA
jgi:glyoxalase family protein